MLQPSVTLDRPEWGHRSSGLQILTLDAPAKWDVETQLQLLRLTKLPVGWDGYNSVPVKQEVAYFARAVLYQVMTDQIPTPTIVPISGGGVQIEWYVGDVEVELAIRRPFDVEFFANCGALPVPIEDNLSSDFTSISQLLRKCFIPASV